MVKCYECGKEIGEATFANSRSLPPFGTFFEGSRVPMVASFCSIECLNMCEDGIILKYHPELLKQKCGPDCACRKVEEK